MTAHETNSNTTRTTKAQPMSYYSQGGGGGGYGGGNAYNQPPGGYSNPPGNQQNPGYPPNNDPNAWQQQPAVAQPQYAAAPAAPQNPYGFNAAAPQPASMPQAPGLDQFMNPQTMAATSQFIGLAASTLSTPGSQDAVLKMGATFLDQSTARMIPGLELLMTSLRRYFAVDNSYVQSKMKRVSFPFLVKQWKRQQTDVAPTADNRIPPPTFALPVHDPCAPDLYIPLMSGVTYVLLTAVLYGAAGKFNPAIISSVCTSNLLWLCVTVAAMRFALYVAVEQQQPTAASSIHILDLFCYAGYQYTGLCWNLLVAVILRQVGVKGGILMYYYITLAYTASATAYFLLKTFSNAIPKTPHSPSRDVVVLALAASPFVTMWLVSPTKVL